MSSASLLQLYQNHHGKVSDKWLSYLTIYDRILSVHRTDPVRILEIGIQNGGSLEIWAKYFQDASIILGCDIDQACSELEFDDDRIRTLVENVNSEKCLSTVLELVSNLDIVIDDGSHSSSDIIQSFARYFPHVSQNGLYIIEDLHCSYWDKYEGGLFHPMSSISFFKGLVDIINFDHWGTDRSRASTINGILDSHGASLDEAVLADIHSVEFLNSMCIVRKAPVQENQLGNRIVVGTIAHVDTSPLDCRPATPLISEPQDSNVWSNLTAPPAEELKVKLFELGMKEKEISSLSLQVSEYESAIDQLSNSLSWRLTYPLRLAWDVLHSLGQMKDSIRSVIRSEGGPFNTSRALYSVVKTEGVREAWCRIHRTLTDSGHVDYAEWIQAHDTLDNTQRSLIRDQIAGFRDSPLISILMPTYNTPLNWLADAIDSVKNQLYENWELCIADDASTTAGLREYLEGVAELDPRIKVIFRTDNGHISSASNSALQLCSGEWTALFDHDDLLPEHALFHVVETINQNPEVQLIYSDEDKVDERGNRADPYFKCAWNRDLFYSQNLISHLGVYKTALLKDLGGFRQGFEGSQDHDLALRYIERIKPEQIYHIPHVLYHWRVHRKSASHSSRAKPYAATAGVNALQSHFDREGVSAMVGWTGVGYRVQYEIESPHPLVSIVIRSRNAKRQLRRLVDSLELHTHYQNFEVLLLDYNSDDLETLNFYRELEQKNGYRIVRQQEAPGTAQLINSGVQQSRGSIICVLSDNAELISEQWLTELVSIAQQPEVAAVGPKLIKPDGRVQCCGLILGGEHVHSPAFNGMPSHHAGYFGRAELISSYTAITSDCLVINKNLFQKVGGFSGDFTTPVIADIDFCLRLREAGFRTVTTPFARIILHEPKSPLRLDGNPEFESADRDILVLKERWGKLIENDPGFSPNLSTSQSGFSIARPPGNKSL